MSVNNLICVYMCLCSVTMRTRIECVGTRVPHWIRNLFWYIKIFLTMLKMSKSELQIS